MRYRENRKGDILYGPPFIGFLRFPLNPIYFQNRLCKLLPHIYFSTTEVKTCEEQRINK